MDWCSGSGSGDGIQFCIFDLSRGQFEGEEILFFFPADVPFSTQLSVIGWQGIAFQDEETCKDTKIKDEIAKKILYLQREEVKWGPSSVLCKRFDLTDPYMGKKKSSGESIQISNVKRKRTALLSFIICCISEPEKLEMIPNYRGEIYMEKCGAKTLVSLLYLMDMSFKGIGQSAIWAVMTVVVVLEFTAGATLCKGLNRGLGTLLAGSLAFFIEYIANDTGHVFRAVFIGSSVFFVGFASTYVRFIPKIKKNYDNGVLIFLLTFNLITLVSMNISMLLRMKQLPQNERKMKRSIKASHASWEPRHWRHCKYPCEQYVKVGAVLRQFGYSVVALHGCLQTEIQTPKSVRRMFKSPCTRLAGEVTKALIELANSIKNRRHCSPEILSDHLHEALQDLNTAIKSQPRLFLGSRSHHSRKMLALAAAHAQKHNEVSISSVKTDSSALHDWKYKRSRHEKETKVLRPQLNKIASLEFSEALPFAAFASLLVEIVARLDNVIEEVEELGRIACFKEFVTGRNDDHIVDMKKVNK
ncbi:hypothetical protein ACFE04_027329 [Oxalis oulophora]